MVCLTIMFDVMFNRSLLEMYDGSECKNRLGLGLGLDSPSQTTRNIPGLDSTIQVKCDNCLNNDRSFMLQMITKKIKQVKTSSKKFHS